MSVLVRTIGRGTLAKAIGSVVEQSFSDWEIVVVNAGARPLDPASLGKVDPLRLTCIEPLRPLDRSAAANRLIDAAKGRYALFLDDDDWLLPDHLKKLVEALDASPDCVAAYADVQMMKVQGDHMEAAHLFASDFDPLRLQFENYLPIHSVLFRRTAVDALPACRFGTELELFEDWDFWIQLAQKGSFQRLPGVSAVYALSVDAGSGHTRTDSELRQRMLEQLATRQLSRWTPRQVSDLMGMVAESQRLQQLSKAQIAATREESRMLLRQSTAQQNEIRKLEQLRLQHLQQISDLNDQLISTYRSRSWRITRPLRAVSRAMRWVKAGNAWRLLQRLPQALMVELRRHGWLGFLSRVPFYVRNFRHHLPRLTSANFKLPTVDFHAPASVAREVKLHPDLTGGGDTLDFKVSVVIPTLNAGPEFPLLLRKLRTQKGVRQIEIVIVDSGSTDRTVPFAHEADCTVVEILPQEFTHSHARNLGAEAASGDYVLFMVQDAYPIGEHWMHGMLRFLLDHADEKVVAASCAEYSRSDSDMMYDAMVNTHYRFLGCLEYDRIGEYQGADHMALRSQGQLSDVSCLISRDCFMQYRYQGDYAEDLDLGIRLIKDGYRVAMLASVKVIHSHNRSAYYYLKRSFVDVIFLVGLFDDFTYPKCASSAGLLAGILSTAARVSSWLGRLDAASLARPLGDEIKEWIQDSLQAPFEPQLEAPLALGDEKLEKFLLALSHNHLSQGAALDGQAHAEARRFADSFLARLEHFNQFAAAVYGHQDGLLRQELRDAVCKTFAATVGSALAFFYLGQALQTGPESDMANALYRELKAGV